MRFRIFIKNHGTESMLYDTEIGDLNGPLSQPMLTLEYGKAGSLEFVVHPGHPFYDSFYRFSTYLRVMRNEDEVFRGRVLDIQDDLDMNRTITAEGDLTYLVDSLQVPDNTNNPTSMTDLTTNNSVARASITTEAQRAEMPPETLTISRVDLSGDNIAKETVYAHFARFITTHNSQVETEKQFTVGTVNIDDKDVEQEWTSTNYRDTKTAIENDLIKYYGGYLRTRKTGNVVYIDWLSGPTAYSEQPIILGMNLIDMQINNAGEEIFTRFVPIGKDQLTISSVNDGKSYIQDDDLYAQYGAIYKTEEFSSVDDPTELMRIGEAYFLSNGDGGIESLSVKAVDMNLLNDEEAAIEIGTVVTTHSDPHDLEASLIVIQIEYDIQNPENNNYEIGYPEENLSEKTTAEKTQAAEATSAATTKASRNGAAVTKVETAVNRHAQDIIDQADKMYKIQADELNIKARVITIEADLLEIHTRALEITSEYVTVTCDTINFGNSMTIYSDTSGGSGQFNDTIVLSASNIEMMGPLTMDYPIYMPNDVDTGYYFNNSDTHLTAGELLVPGIYLGNDNSNQDMGEAIVSFGTVTVRNKVVKIPYTKANGDSTGVIQFTLP